MSDTIGREFILIAPHQFPSLAKERVLAEEFGLDLVVAADVDDFKAAMPDATLVLLTPYARIDADDFAAMKKCRAVIRYGIGYDNIDVAAAQDVGIPVSIVPDAASEEVAFHAVALGLALVRRIPEGNASILSGSWAGSIGFDGPILSSLEVGIVGLGRIGRLVARSYEALGATVRGFDPAVASGTSVSLDEVLEQSDIVSLHLPLTEATRNVIDADRLRSMRPGVVLVNVSRGGLIDEHALAAALEDGSVGGAGLDVFSTEPLPVDHPLRVAPRALLTPHIAWRSDRALDRLQGAVMTRAYQVLTGQELVDLVT